MTRYSLSVDLEQVYEQNGLDLVRLLECYAITATLWKIWDKPQESTLIAFALHLPHQEKLCNNEIEQPVEDVPNRVVVGHLEDNLPAYENKDLYRIRSRQISRREKRQRKMQNREINHPEPFEDGNSETQETLSYNSIKERITDNEFSKEM